MEEGIGYLYYIGEIPSFIEKNRVLKKEEKCQKKT